jgi:flavin reductase (DIM6/NTAB) family NADH-FMN oxidoreductase RutF
MFKAAMRHHAKSVAVVTTGVESPAGFCATSLTSVSLHPPLVSFTVGLQSASWAAVRGADYVIVHLLTDQQENLARRFGQAGVARFESGTRWHRGVHDLPILDDVLAWMLVKPMTRLPIADHALVLGRVLDIHHAAEGRPLIYHDGAFVRLA